MAPAAGSTAPMPAVGGAAGSVDVPPPPPAPPMPAPAGSAGMPAAGGGNTPVMGLKASDVLRDSCARSTVESSLLPANILFVVDRSGSMQCNPPPTTQSAACEQLPMRARANAPSKWEITSQALIESLRALPETTTVGLAYFSNDDTCGVSATPSVALGTNTSMQQSAIATSLRAVTPSGGTPLVGATILAYSHLHKAAVGGQIYGNKFVVLITDGAQSEACSYAPRCADAMSCTDLLVNQEVPKAFGKGVGIRTFVVGVPGSEPARSTLSQMADRGGTAPEGCDPTKDDCHFDMTTATDLAAALSSTLQKISGEAIGCELEVPKPDQGEFDPNLVNVVYAPGGGGEPNVVRQDPNAVCEAGANGWQYNADQTKIRLCGDICTRVRSDAGARVDVVLGCPVLLI